MFLAAGINTAAFAQDMKTREDRRAMTPEQRAGKRTDHMAASLNLTEAQKKQVYQLNLESGRQSGKMRSENKTEMKQAYKEREEKLKAILTPEQMSKYEEQKKARMMKMQEQKKYNKKQSTGFNKNNAPVYNQ